VRHAVPLQDLPRRDRRDGRPVVPGRLGAARRRAGSPRGRRAQYRHRPHRRRRRPGRAGPGRGLPRDRAVHAGRARGDRARPPAAKALGPRPRDRGAAGRTAVPAHPRLPQRRGGAPGGCPPHPGIRLGRVPAGAAPRDPGAAAVSSAAARAMARADELAACTEHPGEITRRYGTPALVAARDLLEGWMLETGMRTRVDRAGNLIGTLGQGERPGIVIGSHFDSVVDAGRYDGTLGILLGIGCAEQLAGAEPAHDLTVVAFCDEEGARFPTDYFGSRAFLGRPLPDVAMTDAEGATLASGIELAGNGAAEPGSGLPANAVAYLEAHIEQGPVLEAAGHPLGIVTSITGGAKLMVALRGTAGLFGTLPMCLRRDAFSLAAVFLLSFEALARDDGEAVATVGQVAVSPGAANVIPGRAAISIDLRHQDDDRRAGLLAGVGEIVAEVAGRRRVDAAVEVV